MADPATRLAGRVLGWRLLALSLAVFALIAAGLFLAVTLADRRATLDQGWAQARTTAALMAQPAERLLRFAEITTVRVAELATRNDLLDLRDAEWANVAELADDMLL